MTVDTESADGALEAMAARETSDSSLCNTRVSGRSGRNPAPAAAIICGLSGLDVELALPFLECWIPWTIEVCLWWPYVADFGSTTRSKIPPSPPRAIPPRTPGDVAEAADREESDMPARPLAESFSIDDSREWITEREMAESGLLCLRVCSQPSASWST